MDGSRLAVVGNSVGGNMAAVVALMAKDKQGPKIKLQVLLWPVTDANFETDSYKQYGLGRFLLTYLPHWFKTAENDVLRDEGEAYARKLDEAGVPTTQHEV